jgi:ectoine hydroxylase
MLAAAQRDALLDDGFLSISSLFSEAEIEPLRQAADRVMTRGGPNVIREVEDASRVRMVFGAHVEDDAFARLSRHPRLIEPVIQTLGEPVHLFQSRFNQWHRQDGLLTPRATVIGVFLDDVNPCNGPLMMIPGSHRRGFHSVPDMMDIPFDVITELANEHGIVPLMGPPGTTIFFDCLTIHGSAPNISPWPRRIFYCNYIPATCYELQPLRAWFHCDTAVAPLAALSDDCLRSGAAQ